MRDRANRFFTHLERKVSIDDMRSFALRVFLALDGKEWSADTADEIADAIRNELRTDVDDFTGESI